MKRRPIFCLLAGILTLTACSPAPSVGPDDPAGQTIQTPAPTPSPSPAPEPSGVEPEVYAPGVPPGDYASWQIAYMRRLTELCQEEQGTMEWLREASAEGLRDGPEWDERADRTSNLYSLYDVDGDGVPELFIEYGINETRRVDCYTFRDSRLRLLGSVEPPSPDTSVILFSCPGESAFLLHTHDWKTSYMAIEKYSVEDGRLIGQGEIFGEYSSVAPDSTTLYTRPEEIVPGAFALEKNRVRLGWLDNTPLLLPICDHGIWPRRLEDPVGETEVRTAIGEVLWGNGDFLGVSSNQFWGSTGQVSLGEYLTQVYPYGDDPLVPREYAFADANGDGQTDCILRLEGKEGDNTLAFQTVFSVQDGVVYAYFFDGFDAVGVDPDGTVYFQQLGDWRQISFYQSQCYAFPAPQDPVEGCDLAWDEYAPNP